MDLDDEELEATKRLHGAIKDEIKVGEYVRSWNGSIGKVTRIEEGRFLYDNKELICFIASVVKHSKNIIDLIVEGDVIELNDKKYEVIFDKSYEKLGLLIPNREHLAIRHCSLEYIFSNEGIKEFESISIITKEQIKQIEYRIKE